MEKIQLTYSTKNIPLPPRNVYKAKLINKVESVIRRMRWKAHFFLNPTTDSSPKQTYGFKTRKCPPQIEELKKFENDLFKMVEDIRFRTVNDQFLNALKRHQQHQDI